MIREAQHNKSTALPPLWRPAVLLILFVLLAALLVWRALNLQVIDQGFFQGQGDARHLRVVEMPAHRGEIVDRNGVPLAISSPVDSVWVNPKELAQTPERLPALARALEMDPRQLARRVAEKQDKEFLYVKRHLTPEQGTQVMDLKVPGVSLQREYRRFYPAGEVTAHVLGFTDIDDRGQEGMELAYNEWLRGEPGAKRVVRDRLGRIVDDVESLREPKPGKPLTLAIDRRIQFLAYRELKAAVQEHKVRSASLVMLDVDTGEVLAMVNQPAFNPNNRGELGGGASRNRAVTDVFEPGSTVKPFLMAAALDTGRYTPGTIVNTSPGWMTVGRFTIRDPRNYGVLDLTTILAKSSTIGTAKVALDLPPEAQWELMGRVGFGQPTGSGFPGEVSGTLAARPPTRESERATLSYGYGLSATPLQLAAAYSVIAADGVRRPVSFLKVAQAPAGEPVMNPATARSVRRMMEVVVSPKGTARQAQVSGYRVAGKTGTAKKAEAGGYADKRYTSFFAGMAPASRPRLVMVLVMDEPGTALIYGGQIAAPAFSRVMGGALRILNVAPDDYISADAAAPAGEGV